MTQARPPFARDEPHEPSDDELRAAVACAVGVEAAQIALHSTHASRVAVGGGLAFKFKRWVDLGFLDHRSEEARERNCRDEVRLNSRFAPEVYLGVACVRRIESALVIDWPAAAPVASCVDAPPQRDPDRVRVIDWAVVMRELPQERMLDHLLEADAGSHFGAQEEAELLGLARRVAVFHRHAERGPDIAALRTPDQLRSRLRQVLEDLDRAVGVNASLASVATVRFLRTRAAELLEASMPVIESRRMRGCVVDGHGDLHGRNICMTPGAPVLFDCLEFSQALRVRDTSAEIAFLAMDLVAHGQGDLAESVVRAYLQEARSDAGGAAREIDFEVPQPWYRLSDALVRAMVESMRAAQVLARESARAACERQSMAREPIEAWRFLDLACGLALSPAAVIMCGVPGSGKSTVARALAVPLQAVVLRSDAIRKELAGIAPTARADASLYRPEVTERVYGEMIRGAREALGSGHHVILDAAFPLRSQREQALSALTAAGWPWLLVHCEAPERALEQRLRRRTEDPAEISDADDRVRREVEQHFEPPIENDEAKRVILDTHGRSLAAARHEIIEALVKTACSRNAPP